MFWLFAGGWLFGAVAWFFILGLASRSAHGVAVMTAAVLWPVLAPVQLMLVARRRLG